MSVFNKEKFKTVLHYIISKCGHQDNVGKTVLYKLMYFSDFDFYEIYEEKMTGEDYVKLPRGPGPENFNEVIGELETEGKITQAIINFDNGAHQYRYFSKNDPSIDLLSSQELDVINNVLNKCSSMRAGAISNYSHEDLPWQATDMYDVIDYELVFYRNPEFSVRVYEED